MEAEIIKEGIFQCRLCVPNNWTDDQIIEWFTENRISHMFVNIQPKILTQDDFDEAAKKGHRHDQARLICEEDKDKIHLVVEF